MAQGTRRKRRDEIKLTIAPFQSQTDYKSAVDIQREVWKFDDIDIIPPSMLLASDHIGGISLGAYNTIGEMVGFVSSFLGTEDGILIQHSHMLAVRQAYRNFGVGYRLKLAQRKESLKRKIRKITWTFDPVQPLNAYFNLGKLGARSNVYAENFYGESSSVLHRGLPTDRLLARWDLDSSATVKRLETGAPRRELRKELKKLEVINRLEDVSPGMTTSSPVKLTSTADQLLFEVPYNLPTIKVRDLGVALEWQGKMRQVFRAYFKKGYVASDFWVGEEEGHLRAFYYLEKGRR
ncbi:MAG: Chorismate synthase [Acidobacteria bacterium]|nr:Chorismate synthase [Acidobacteriota bacterium]